MSESAFCYRHGQHYPLLGQCRECLSDARQDMDRAHREQVAAQDREFARLHAEEAAEQRRWEEQEREERREEWRREQQELEWERQLERDEERAEEARQLALEKHERAVKLKRLESSGWLRSMELLKQAEAALAIGEGGRAPVLTAQAIDVAPDYPYARLRRAMMIASLPSAERRSLFESALALRLRSGLVESPEGPETFDREFATGAPEECVARLVREVVLADIMQPGWQRSGHRLHAESLEDISETVQGALLEYDQRWASKLVSALAFDGDSVEVLAAVREWRVEALAAVKRDAENALEMTRASDRRAALSRVARSLRDLAIEWKRRTNETLARSAAALHESRAEAERAGSAFLQLDAATRWEDDTPKKTMGRAILGGFVERLRDVVDTLGHPGGIYSTPYAWSILALLVIPVLLAGLEPRWALGWFEGEPTWLQAFLLVGAVLVSLWLVFTVATIPLSNSYRSAKYERRRVAERNARGAADAKAAMRELTPATERIRLANERVAQLEAAGAAVDPTLLRVAGEPLLREELA